MRSVTREVAVVSCFLFLCEVNHLTSSHPNNSPGVSCKTGFHWVTTVSRKDRTGPRGHQPDLWRNWSVGTGRAECFWLWPPKDGPSGAKR